jgi:hypothetical protein
MNKYTMATRNATQSWGVGMDRGIKIAYPY